MEIVEERVEEVSKERDEETTMYELVTKDQVMARPKDIVG